MVQTELKKVGLLLGDGVWSIVSSFLIDSAILCSELGDIRSGIAFEDQNAPPFLSAFFSCVYSGSTRRIAIGNRPD